MRNYKVKKVLSDTPTLKIFQAQSTQPVLIKQYKDVLGDQSRKKQIQKQIYLHHTLQHKNILKLQKTFQRNSSYFLVFQYLNQNLKNIVHEDIPNHTIAKYFYKILEGLDYMHTLNFIHRNLKPQNILLFEGGILKISDLTSTCPLKNKMTENITTRWYRAPQILVGYTYDHSIDIWSLGCIFAEFVLGQPLFPGTNQIDQLSKICQLLGQLPSTLRMQLEQNLILRKIKNLKGSKKIEVFYKLQKKLGSEGLNLIKRMLQLNPLQRITASEAKKHEYFNILKDLGAENQKKVSNWLHLPHPSIKQNMVQKWNKNLELSMTSRAIFYHKKRIQGQSLKGISEEKDSIINFYKMNETSCNINHFFKTTNSMKKLRQKNLQRSQSKLKKTEQTNKIYNNKKQKYYAQLFNKLAVKNKNFRSLRNTLKRF